MTLFSSSRVLLFGKLRSFAPGGNIQVPTCPEMTLPQFRLAVAKILSQSSAAFPGVRELSSSAVVSGDRILGEGDLLGEGTEFALLPPVCGG